jgi:hypothetical protein
VTPRAATTTSDAEQHFHLIPILKASFDAGLLLDESGSILCVNTVLATFLACMRDPENLALIEALVLLQSRDTNHSLYWDRYQVTRDILGGLQERESGTVCLWRGSSCHCWSVLVTLCSPTRQFKVGVTCTSRYSRGRIIDPFLKWTKMALFKWLIRLPLYSLGGHDKSFWGTTLAWLSGKNMLPNMMSTWRGI